VWDSVVSSVPDVDGYAVVYCDEGTLQRDAVAANPVSRRVGWQVSCFGPTRQAAAWLSGRITAALLASGISVDGWGVGVATHDYTRAPAVDEDVKERIVVQTVDQFSMWLAKAD
jgi:uncharacterized protein YbdZ (MbtH family)